MSRRYTPYSTSGQVDEPVDYPYPEDWDSSPYSPQGYGSSQGYGPDDYPRDDYPYEDYPDHDHPGHDHPLGDEFPDFTPTPVDNQWVWVAGVAGAILLVAVICTAVILGGGDSGSVSAVVAPPESTQPAPTEPRTVIATPAPPTQSLPPERITTVTPAPSAPAAPPENAPPENAAPEQAAPPPSETVAPSPAPAPSPRTVTYRVTGERPLLDLVTIIYTDQQGALHTDVNVALPWSKTFELNPGVDLTSVTATSVGSRLNCSITDADGATIVAQNSNSIIATCIR